METCTNCGAALRPGARFCTTCGTRLNDSSQATTTWGAPPASASNDVQETTVLETVKSTASEPAASITDGDSQREFDRWTNAYSNATTATDDPASRFISALEQTPTPVKADTPGKPDEIQQSETHFDPASTWVTPPPDAFTAPSPTGWNDQASVSVNDTVADAGWRTPSSWGSVSEAASATEEPAATGAAGIESASREEIPAWGETSAEADAADEVEIDAEAEAGILEEEIVPDAAGFHDGGTAEVDYLSGDENIDVSGPDTPVFSPEDARTRAIALVDELRRMLRLMPGGGVQDAGAAAMALTEASLKVSDFADLREAIVELQEDPRDIQALSNLARMADKIELLLDEHQSLAAVIETALQELSGQN